MNDKAGAGKSGLDNLVPKFAAKFDAAAKDARAQADKALEKALGQLTDIAENGRKQMEGIVRQAQKEARQAVGKVKQATGNKSSERQDGESDRD